jgi:hypothetical protein
MSLNQRQKKPGYFCFKNKTRQVKETHGIQTFGLTPYDPSFSF